MLKEKSKKSLICFIIVLLILAIIGGIYYLNKNNKSSEELIQGEQYKIIEQELEGIDLLFITDAEKNSDDTYTLKGVIYTQYTISEQELEEILTVGEMEIEGEKYILEVFENGYNLVDKERDLVVYSIQKNDMNQYILERQAQFSNMWELTEEYRKITISGDTTCVINEGLDSYDSTVEKVFENYEKVTPQQTTVPSKENSFVFEFQDGVVTRVINYLTTL